MSLLNLVRNVAICSVFVLFSGAVNALAPAHTQHGLEFLHAHDEIESRMITGAKALRYREVLGEVDTLVLMVSFADRDFQTSVGDWQERFFEGDRSVAEYFDWASNGEFNLIAGSAGIVEVELSSNHPNSGSSFSRAKELASDAMRKAGEKFNYSMYDKNGDGAVSPDELAIIMVIAGYDMAFGGTSASTPNVWAHQSTSTVVLDGVRLGEYAMFGELHGQMQASIGIIAHELGHLIFNLPDLYDRDGSSTGVGNWGLMGRGVWNSKHGQLGDSPAGMLAWSKKKAGFLIPDQVATSVDLELDIDEVAQINITDNEYFLIERRERESFDAGLPGAGILITHVDESRRHNDDENHKLIDIESADGLDQMDEFLNGGDAGDVFPGVYGVISFGEQTQPSSKLYSGVASGLEVSLAPGTDQVSISLDNSTMAEAKQSQKLNSEEAGSFGVLVLLIGLLIVRKRKLT